MAKRSDSYPTDAENAGSYYPFAKEKGEIHITHSSYRPELIDHSHGFAELICITEGEGIHVIDGKEYPAHQGDLFLIDYGTSHKFVSESESFCWINCIFRPEYLTALTDNATSAKKLLCCIFDGSCTDGDGEGISLNTNLRAAGEDTVAIFRDMLREYDKKAHGYEKILEHYLWILLEKISRKLFLGDEKTKNKTVMESVLSDLDNALPGQVSAKQLADSYFMSKPTFSENFKKYMGMSFSEYVTSARIKHACRLLTEEDCSVAEVQLAAGYQDSKSFYRAFRRYTGLTPSEYKKKNKE